MFKKLLAGLALALVALLPLAGTAAAATPTINRTWNAPIVGFYYVTCPQGFDLLFDGEADLRDVVYIDAAGTQTREAFSAHWKGILYNSLTGKSIDDSGSLIQTTDLATGVTSFSAVFRHDTVPHLGLVLLDSGHGIFDSLGNPLFLSASAASPADILAACDYFAS
jgi:hypothetical protein